MTVVTAKLAAGKLDRHREDKDPVNTKYHSLLTLTPDRRLYQVEVDPKSGEYKQASEEVTGTGLRKVFKIAGETPREVRDEEPGAPRAGCSVALLPIKDEPNSGHICCYLMNTRRLNVEESGSGWDPSKHSSEPADYDLTPLLVATADRKVFRVSIPRGKQAVQPDEYPEVWRVLGNGALAGEVSVEGGRWLPVVNLSSFWPAKPVVPLDPYPNLLTLNEPPPPDQSAESELAVYAVAADGNAYPAPPVRLEGAEREEVLALAGEGAPDTGKIGAATFRRPNTASVHLLNGVRLNVINVWTVAEWSDQYEVDAEGKIKVGAGAKARLATKSAPEMFVAMAPGVVYRVPVEGEPIDLRQNVEIWRLLRNGCLAGQVTTKTSDGQSQFLPLVNLASFSRGEEPKDVDPRTLNASTWDFKWPAGKVLRVRFVNFSPASRYSSEVIVALKERVQRLAQTWVEGTNLRLDDFAAFVEGDEYDVLVDLNDLTTVQIPPNRARAGRGVALPFSEIGSYASRLDYAHPTIYLGWPEGIKDEQGVPIPRTTKVHDGKLDGYFSSEAFTHIFLHEFGHALGLPHLHQSPDLPDPFVDAQDAMRVIKRDLGIEMELPEVIEELKLRWVGPGAGPSTDWFDVKAYYKRSLENDIRQLEMKLADQPQQAQSSDIPAQLLRLKELLKKPDDKELVERLAANSVMMGLPARSVYAERGFAMVDYLPTLGEIDKAWIKQLYP